MTQEEKEQRKQMDITDAVQRYIDDEIIRIENLTLTKI